MQSGVLKGGMGEWSVLSVERDHETLALLHLASQMLGKVRVAHSPWVNHGWHATLRPTAFGLSILPTAAADGRTFALGLDLCRHGIALQISDGAADLIPFAGKTIAQLHSELRALLNRHHYRRPSTTGPTKSPTPCRSRRTGPRAATIPTAPAGCTRR